ncbi:type III pantothenate kinase [soil metagenome]
MSDLADPSIRMVIDLGNSRLKWGLAGRDGSIPGAVATPTDDPAAWSAALQQLDPKGQAHAWAVSSVNPPVAERLADFLRQQGADDVQWFRSAADVPIRNRLEHAETAGADRALAVLAAVPRAPSNRPGQVVSCGTAITVERIDRDGLWLGGAIAPGLALVAGALQRGTAQLPMVTIDEGASPPPPSGPSTASAMAAGIFWGTLGAIRELVQRGSEGPDSWRIWTGGDASWLAPQLDGPQAWIVPDLVLLGLARAAFGASGESETR